MTEEVKEKKEKEVWSIDDLVQMTETIQTADVEYAGKTLTIQWCELVESEEPKSMLADEEATEAEQTAHYQKMATVRCLAMIEKANNMNPEGTTISEETWLKIPTTLKWNISGKILAGQSENFTTG
jgi:hypothetical protein